MPGRSFSTDGYRYAYNGKEKDDEVKGNGMQYDYGFRIYDPRLGKFLSVDPITKDYPMLTPFQYASNSPIACIDIDGLEGTPNTGFGSDPMATMAYHMSTYFRSAAQTFDNITASVKSTLTYWFTSVDEEALTKKDGISASVSGSVSAEPSKLFVSGNYGPNNSYNGGKIITINVEASVDIKSQLEAKITTPIGTIKNETTITGTILSTNFQNAGNYKVENEFSVTTNAWRIPFVIIQKN